MSGGKRIDDRSFFAGSGSPTFPKGVHEKKFSSASDAGHEAMYEDTTEAIKKVQDMSASKAKSQKMKDGYRY
jgi:hypothetical protein